MVTMKHVISFCLGLLIVFPTLSQELVFGDVEKLPASINSPAEESMPLLAPDGRTLYFTRLMSDQNVGGKFAGQDIWVSKFDGTKWLKADNRGYSLNNDKKNNAVIGVSRDGKTIYSLNVSSNERLKGVYLSKNVMSSRTEPELIPIDGIEYEGFLGLYVSPDREVILLSMKGRDSKGEEDIYVSLKDAAGKWSEPRNIGPTINTSGFEISPFLSDDKKRLYFSSNGHQGLGNADIFYSDRLHDSWETWSVPKNLGNVINSPSFDAFFSLQNDSLAFFASNREAGMADIYRSKLAPAPQPTVVVTTQFLGDKETTDIIRDQPFIRFDAGSGDLTQGQEEKISRVAGHLSLKKDIQIVLVAMAGRQNTDLELFKKRLNIVLEKLRLGGVEGSRVTFSIEALSADNPGAAEAVKISLFR